MWDKYENKIEVARETVKRDSICSIMLSKAPVLNKEKNLIG